MHIMADGIIDLQEFKVRDTVEALNELLARARRGELPSLIFVGKGPRRL
jgi:hypothetical protein